MVHCATKKAGKTVQTMLDAELFIKFLLEIYDVCQP